MSLALTRLIRGVAALSVGSAAATRPVLLAVTTRAASSQSQATVEIPANIVFAEEKPVRAPRVIPTAQKGAYGDCLYPSINSSCL